MSEVTGFTASSLGGQLLPDKTNSTELVAAGFITGADIGDVPQLQTTPLQTS